MSGNIVFDRYYKVTFVDLSREVKTGDTEGDANLWSFIADDTANRKSAFQMVGTINKSLKSSGDSPSSALKLTMTNLPKDILTRLSSAEILRIHIDLGYKNYNVENSGTKPLVGNVFTGDVKAFSTTVDGLNYKTSFEAVEGITEKTGSTVSLAVEPKTTVESVFKSIVKSFSDVYLEAKSSTKVTVSAINTVFDTDSLKGKSFSNHRSFEGTTLSVLAELCQEYKVNWILTGGTVYIFKKAEREEKKIFNSIIIEEGNVIGGLGASFETVSKNSKDTTQSSQVKMKTFLDPRIGIESVITLSKDFDSSGVTYSGKYLPTSWVHSFDYRGNNWNTTVEMVRINKTEATDA